MDFPAQSPTPVIAEEAEARKAEFAAALGVQRDDVLYVGQGPPTTPDWMVEVAPAAFARLAPDAAAISRISPLRRGLIATCRGPKLSEGDAPLPVPPAAKRPRILDEGDTGGELHFLSRFFAPTLGIPEDPVTGSAHCILAPYWAGKQGAASQMSALQASQRGGVLRVTYLEAERRVQLEGQAVTTIRGKFMA